MSERRYNAPLLVPGTRLVLPAGIKAVPVLLSGWFWNVVQPVRPRSATSGG